MPVLAGSFNMGSLGGSCPASMALAAFGPEGAGLAAQIPPPAPGRFDTGIRMTQHRGGVRVLAENKDIRGIEEILSGLKTLQKDTALDIWSTRAGIYLTAAGQYHDDRLVEPLLHILQTKADPYERHHKQVIRLLSAYSDARISPAIIECIKIDFDPNLFHEHELESTPYLQNEAITALSRLHGEKTAAFLLDAFPRSVDSKLRFGIVVALGKLSCPAAWSADRFKSEQERESAAGLTRKQALPVLLQALQSSQPQDSAAAAHAIAWLASRCMPPDAKTIAALTAWCERSRRSFERLSKLLGDHGTPETGRVLLDVFTSESSWRSSGLVGALTKLKPPGTVEVFTRNILSNCEKNMNHCYPTSQLHALTSCGPEGLQALMAILETTGNIHCKAEASCSLGEADYAPAAEAIAGALRETAAAGVNNPRLAGRSDDRQERFVKLCTTMLAALARLDTTRAREIAAEILAKGPEELRAAAAVVWSGGQIQAR
jgi:hypothetical protein